ncbi:MAG TPA: nuclear transport factor 2 family protein [Candidatus Baltobacteraceae bacterium]|nr:nuclear transport factor 2 family protein [Candidatus Baltobacteraceae bacterium]
MRSAPRNLNTVILLLAVLALASPTPASPQDGVLAADHSLTAAINKADQSSVEKLLDPEFTWTDRTGKTRSKSEILPALASLASESDADVKIINAGQVVLIHGNHRIPSPNASVRFIRVWVKRAQAWQLLVYQETNKAEKNPEKRSGFGAPSNGQPVACENPCKTVPYKPDTAAEQEVVSMWQAVERTVLTNDVEAWTPNFTDDFIFVTPDGGAPLNKADRVTMITELRRTNTTLIPAEVTSMKVWVLGDAAVMRSEHKPLRGKVLHVTRLFEKHNNHWQIAFGQQTWVE